MQLKDQVDITVRKYYLRRKLLKQEAFVRSQFEKRYGFDQMEVEFIARAKNNEGFIFREEKKAKKQ